MGKQSRRENRRNRDQRPEPANEGGARWFMGVVLLILVAGGAVVALFASQHESAVGVAPEAGGIDHWHDAFLIHACGEDLPASTNDNDPAGIHTHGRGLVHVHPFNPSTAGPNATFGQYVAAIGAELTDDTYTPGPGELPTVLSEQEGCDGEPAVLQLAYWENAWQEEDPVIITQNLADFRFDSQQGSAITLALLPEGADIPKPPQERLDLLETTNGGQV